jgi:hypothetical protein
MAAPMQPGDTILDIEPLESTPRVFGNGSKQMGAGVSRSRSIPALEQSKKTPGITATRPL